MTTHTPPRSPRQATRLTGALALAAALITASPLAGLAQEEATPASATQATSFTVTPAAGRLYFALAHEGQVVLRSTGYATQRALDEAIDAVRLRARRVKHMPLRQLSKDQHYFVVEDAKGRVLATSPAFPTRELASAARAQMRTIILHLE